VADLPIWRRVLRTEIRDSLTLFVVFRAARTTDDTSSLPGRTGYNHRFDLSDECDDDYSTE